jgi:hypothetical protein
VFLTDGTVVKVVTGTTITPELGALSSGARLLNDT